jgi:hypothetical protein
MAARTGRPAVTEPPARAGLKSHSNGGNGDAATTDGGPKASHTQASARSSPLWREESAWIPPVPAFRKLRGFAVDPSLATQLDTVKYSEITFKVPWEPLGPGPIGEYLEVIDIDPASGCFYDPVDLDDPRLLAQDGLAPSEGTPQFHQQMAYAVASLTIRNFERALGRRVLWRPGPPRDPKDAKDDSVFVRRLRIYPHGLREQNAYYHPDKIALLFGYFNEIPGDPAAPNPGLKVFACLSHDIVAHETTHALLDGMHRRFIRPTNRDVLAFHEAFADIVALFQHFTFPEIVREQITKTRGQIRGHENLLGQLAVQFGRATRSGRALRDAIGVEVNGEWKPRVPDPFDYERVTEPHDRGAILVAAVFDAFLSIYERRTADLLRLATGGSGVLEPGAIPPDLVARLAGEATKSASHVLNMCIRALDYAPPVDITFGEYLRAIVTADADVVPDDDLNYRVAFLEAFRRRGIQPPDVRTLSVESLLWRSPESDQFRPSDGLRGMIGSFYPAAERFLAAQSLGAPHEESNIRPGETGEPPSVRAKLHLLQREVRGDLHETLRAHLKTPEGARDAEFLGLDPSRHFEVHALRYALRASPDGDVVPQMVFTLLQDREVPMDRKDPHGPTMLYEGGCTVVADLRGRRIRYVIRKRANSESRLERQQAFAMEWAQSVRGGAALLSSLNSGGRTFAMLHRGAGRPSS